MELEEFAFQGCPDVRGPQKKQSPEKSWNNDAEDKNVSPLCENLSTEAKKVLLNIIMI